LNDVYKNIEFSGVEITPELELITCFALHSYLIGGGLVHSKFSLQIERRTQNFCFATTTTTTSILFLLLQTI